MPQVTASTLWGENSPLGGVSKLSIPEVGCWASTKIRRQGGLKSVAGVGSEWILHLGGHFRCAPFDRVAGIVDRQIPKNKRFNSRGPSGKTVGSRAYSSVGQSRAKAG